MNLLEILGRIGFDLNVFIFNLINFAIVIFIIKKYFFEKIQNILEERARIVEDVQIKEQKAKELIESAKADAQIIVKKANFEASKLLTTTKEEAEKLEKELIKKHQAELEAKRQKMLEDLALEKTSMLNTFKVKIKDSFTNFLEDFLTKKAKKNSPLIPDIDEYTNSLDISNEKLN